MTTFAVEEHKKPVPLSEFSSHVDRLHEDRDRLFELEYKVQLILCYLDAPKQPLSQ